MVSRVASAAALAAAVASCFLLLHTASGQTTAQPEGTCKEPYVEKRLLSDDVRYAAPFYVVALPRTPKTEEIDNICYTYYEGKGGGPFFHVMSVVFKNGSNEYHRFNKADISDRIGLAQGTADDSESSNCVYHDYTLKPICNMSVFILYRCFIKGECSKIDQGRLGSVDVRVTLAATPKITDACKTETATSLKDTTSLDGGDYIILPQNLTPRCITRYNGNVSINEKRALGATEIGGNATASPAITPDDGSVLGNRLGNSEPEQAPLYTSDPTKDKSGMTPDLDSLISTVYGTTGQPDNSSVSVVPPKKTYAEAVKTKGKKKCIPRRPVLNSNQ